MSVSCVGAAVSTGWNKTYILIYWVRSHELKDCTFFKTIDWDSAKDKKVFIGYIYSDVIDVLLLIA